MHGACALYKQVRWAMYQLFESLAYAHAATPKAVMHRDIKVGVPFVRTVLLNLPLILL